MAAPAVAQSALITADRVLDVERGLYVQNPQIVVVDGRIVSLDGSGAPADAERIDLKGQTLVPGLIDMHVHLNGVADIGGYRGLQYTDSFWSVMGVPNAEATLKAGFTTVRNVGSANYADVALRQAIDAGRIEGPRIVAAGYAIGATGGHCDDNFLPPSYELPSNSTADGPGEMAARVKQMRKYGAEVIKICATGGVFSKGTTVGEQQLTEDEIRAAVEAAHLLGLKVAAHAHGNAGIKAAIRGGVDTVEHASFLDDEAIRLAKEYGAAFSMDIYNTEYTLAEGEKNGVLPESLAKERQVGTVQRESFRRAVKGGAKMVFGSDAAIFPHGLNARQFAVMVRFGMTPLQAIQAATINAADALGREADVGAIKVGAWGDMVAVTGDPLSDVTLLENPSAVIKGGERVR
ncbi:Xaa-Pro dipeptidase [Pacificimonas pallii]|nr:amidohydrolase family protein [Pacificimonas pallii]